MKLILKTIVMISVMVFCLSFMSAAMMAGTDQSTDVSTIIIHHIFVSGNNYSSVDDILKIFPLLKEGKKVDVKSISKEVMLANDSGFRHFAVDLRPISDKEVDVYLTVKESKSEKWMLSVDNTGDNYTGLYHAGTTFIDGNLSGLGDTLMLSYTTSPSQLSNVKQFGMYYNAILPKANDNLYFDACAK